MWSGALLASETRNQTDQKEDQEYDKEDFGNGGGKVCQIAKSKECGENCHNKKDQGITKHERSCETTATIITHLSHDPRTVLLEDEFVAMPRHVAAVLRLTANSHNGLDARTLSIGECEPGSAGNLSEFHTIIHLEFGTDGRAVIINRLVRAMQNRGDFFE